MSLNHFSMCCWVYLCRKWADENTRLNLLLILLHRFLCVRHDRKCFPPPAVTLNIKYQSMTNTLTPSFTPIYVCRFLTFQAELTGGRDGALRTDRRSRLWLAGMWGESQRNEETDWRGFQTPRCVINMFLDSVLCYPPKKGSKSEACTIVGSSIRKVKITHTLSLTRARAPINILLLVKYVTADSRRSGRARWVQRRFPSSSVLY